MALRRLFRRQRAWRDDLRGQPHGHVEGRPPARYLAMAALDPVKPIVGTAVRHPVVTSVLAVGAALILAMSLYIGLDAFFTIPILIATGAVALLLHRWWRGRHVSEEEVPVATAGRLGLLAVGIAGVLVFALIQAVPYGRARGNPEGTGEPQWANARTRELMVAACYDCHSNETEYPAYATVAPFSWAVQRHVDEGREAVNYSNFATDPGDADETIEVLTDGEMPPEYFTRFGLHPGATLSQQEFDELIAGLRATPGMTE